jgi:hypothetical protein
MKRDRALQIPFKRYRIKKNKHEWTTISLEPELIELIKSVFNLDTDEEVKEFVKGLTNEANFNFTTYTQEIKRLIFKKIKERYDTLYSLIQSIIQSKLIK